MSPQGFGFESRHHDRRSGTDRRTIERRLKDRRARVVPVLMENRLVPDRRMINRRAGTGPRRILADRRSFSFRSARGLRITNDVKFYLPPDFVDQ